MQAINVGGRGIVKITDLQAAFVSAGCKRDPAGSVCCALIRLTICSRGDTTAQ
jgi:hypothetical protein